MRKKKILINFILKQNGSPFLKGLCVSDVGSKYEAEQFYENRRREFEKKTFKSDLLFSLAMGHGTRMAEYLARTVTGRKDIELEGVITQKEITNEAHSVRLDALAFSKDGTLINFEMQNSRHPGMLKRLSAYEGSLILSFLAKGDDYKNLPDIITIIFYGYDVYSRGKALYTSYLRDDEGNIIDYGRVRHEVNLSYDGKDEIGELADIIHDFDCWDYHQMRSEVLKEEMKYFKSTKEEVMGYGGDIDGYINEGVEIGRKEGRYETIRTFLENRLSSPEKIAEAFNLPLSEVEKIALDAKY